MALLCYTLGGTVHYDLIVSISYPLAEVLFKHIRYLSLIKKKLDPSTVATANVTELVLMVSKSDGKSLEFVKSIADNYLNDLNIEFLDYSLIF